MKVVNKWQTHLSKVLSSLEYANLQAFINSEYQNYTIYPKKEDIFKALELTSYEDVKVVILGQDPYHNPNQAHGLAFSVLSDIKFPPSLRNIFKELNYELQIPIPKLGNLTKWAKQGVLLLNSVLTVRENEPNSHKAKGWELVTDEIIKILNEKEEPVIFVLWGNDAKAKIRLITNPRHYILTAAHPSPLSAARGFFGCGHFAKINEILKSNNNSEIDWDLTGEEQ